MAKKRPKFTRPSSTKQWIQYGIVVVFVGGGLYLNFSGSRGGSGDDPRTEVSEAPPLPVADNPDEEPGDSSLLPPVYDEEDIARIASEEAVNANAMSDESDVLASSSPRLAGTTLNDYNPTRLWLDQSEEPPAASDQPLNPELGEMAEYLDESPVYVDNLHSVIELDSDAGYDDNFDANRLSEQLSQGGFDEENPATSDFSLSTLNENDAQQEAIVIESDMANADSAAQDTESSASTEVASGDLSGDVERLAQNRTRIEQSVRRGQIPRSQRDEILRSEDFNSVIAAIGRRVGEAWYYEGDDHAEHGAILGIELGSGGAANDIRIRRSSGNDRYNTSVLEAAENSAPFTEVDRLTNTAQTLLNPFSLTFGSMDAIEDYEATWSRQRSINAQGTDESVSDSMENRTVAAIKRTMRNHWPSGLSTGVDHDITLQVTLAVPMGNVADVEFLRSSNNVDLNDRIYQLVRNMPAFSGLRELTLQEQNEVRQFNLHVSPDGQLR